MSPFTDVPTSVRAHLAFRPFLKFFACCGGRKYSACLLPDELGQSARPDDRLRQCADRWGQIRHPLARLGENQRRSGGVAYPFNLRGLQPAVEPGLPANRRLPARGVALVSA